MRAILGALLLSGLLAGCGGPDVATETESKTPGTVTAASCEDCQWIYVRCMSSAETPGEMESCEIMRMDCEAIFCRIEAVRADQ
jgi:hypothetical protein